MSRPATKRLRAKGRVRWTLRAKAEENARTLPIV
jgi:hypothetical protein